MNVPAKPLVQAPAMMDTFIIVDNQTRINHILSRARYRSIYIYIYILLVFLCSFFKSYEITRNTKKTNIFSKYVVSIETIVLLLLL